MGVKIRILLSTYMPRTTHFPVIGESLPVTFRDQSVWRDSAKFPLSAMVELDYDLTCFTTFDAPEGGIEVSRAYEVAVEEVLGKTARRDFSMYGGLSNRAPLDVIEGLIQSDPSFIITALDHAKEHFSKPEDITDISQGLIARFANRNRLEVDELSLRAVTEMLVVRKKNILIPQISSDWPKPIPGFAETWLELHQQKEDGEWPQLETAMVSSGHTDFIALTMDAQGLPHPDMYMTDDEMRVQVEPRTKPDPLALQLVRKAWLNAYLIPPEQREDWLFQQGLRERQVYVGDDASKDGEMARRDGIAFRHFTPNKPNWGYIRNELRTIIYRAHNSAR